MGSSNMLYALRLVVFAVVIVHILSLAVLMAWDSPRSLFGKGSYILNRYSSTHTMHIHKINHVSADAPGTLYSPSDPMHWDALGLIIPAIDESAQIHRYKIGRTRMHSYNASVVCVDGTLPACLLENNAGDYLLLNGDSLSGLSEISPSVYLATLLVVYLLSSIPYVESVVSSAVGFKEDTGKILKKGLMILILIVYFCGLLAAYASSPFNNVAALQIREDVYYSTCSHMASILVCLVTVFIYLLHLRGSNSNLYIDSSGLYSSVDSEESKRQDPIEGIQLTPIKTTSTPEAAASTPAQKKASSMSFSESGEQRENAGPLPRAASLGAMFQGLTWLSNSDSAINTGKGVCLCDASDGPFSSEASVLISITLFLGGFGNIGMSHGVVLEIETQLVLACTLGFAVLEVCSYRLQAYYFYIFDVLLKSSTDTDVTDDKETYYTGIYFIRSVVLVLQSWLLVLYNSTVTEMGYTYSVPERVVFALTTLYFSLQVLLHLYQIALFGVGARKTFVFFTAQDPHGNIHDRMRRAHYFLELGFCVISFFAIFGALFGYAMSNGLHPEGALEQYEKIQYGETVDATRNAFCSETGTYKNVKLIDTELSDEKSRDAKWTESEVDPIDLKVFFWTKYWNVDMSRGSMRSIRKWFCSNGFEHIWMQCLSLDKPLPETVKSAIESGIEKFK